MRWGLIPRWWSKPPKDLMRLSTFNARVETVTTKPFFREAFKRTRCIIPASGYYEWQDTPDGKQPHFFTRIDGQVISFAGLWDEWKDRTSGETVKSCTMIITELNPWSRKFTTAVDVSKVPITDIAPQLIHSITSSGKT
jgi:putative SOS response-associated peptidase YedK